MMKNNITACLILFLCLINIEVTHAQEIDDISLIDTSEVNNDSLIHVAFRKAEKRDILGAFSSVDISSLMDKSYAVHSLDNLESFVGGYTGDIWGQSPLIMIDGVPRESSDIRMVEIESITVLKDASSIAMYGGAGSKGVVLINTRRGKIKPLGIDVRVNTGVLAPKRYASYLNAAEYMTLYNEASRNDGIAERYSPEMIYNTAARTNPDRYPDLNLLSDEYLRNFSTRSDITTEISGGNERARYYSNMGMSYNNDILKYGDAKNNNDLVFNIRTNVDMNLNSWLKASADAVAIIDNNYSARGDFWGSTATLRPNHDWLTPLIPIDRLDPRNPELQTIVQNSQHLIDGRYLLGGLSTMQTNQLSQLLASGYIKNRQRTFMFNVGAEADLNKITEGLRFGTRYSMDYTSMYTEAYDVPYATYQPNWQTVDGVEMITSLTRFGADGNSTNEFIGSSLYNQTVSVSAQLDYDRTFSDDHNVSANLVGWGFMRQFASDPDTEEGGSDYHPVRNTNLGFRAAYNFRHKYYVDLSGSVIHSARLPEHNRRAVSPSATLAWRISEEDFFQNNNTFINDLRLTASYSALKQDIDITSDATDYYLYQGNFGNTSALGGYYQWRDKAAGGFTVLAGGGSNPDLTYVERREFRFGVDASLLNNKFVVNANYFHQNVNGLLSRGAATVFPSFYSGDGNFLPWINFNNDRRSGVDFSVNYNDQIGNVNYSLGVVGMFYDSEAKRRDEIYEDDYQYRVGRPLDAAWGYIAEGFFRNEEEIANHARQTFGGELRPGDIKYRDVNGDGVIDSRDQVDLGRFGWAATPFNYGFNVTLKWKNLTFFALGSGQTGAMDFRNNSYFWVRGLDKYSDVVWGRWTEDAAETATYPRLSTAATNNNFQNSTFWQYRTNRFNLNRVQFTYDLNEDLFKNSSFLNRMSVYINGDNLLVISNERQMMETSFGAAPQNRFYNIGIRASF